MLNLSFMPNKTVRADAMISAISNYSVLHELWDWSLDNCTVTETKAQMRGVQAHLQQFEFIFELVLGRNLLQPTDSLSVYLKRKSLSAAEGQALADMTIKTLKSMITDDKCALFCVYQYDNMKIETPLLNPTKHWSPDTDTCMPTLKPMTIGQGL